MKSQISKSDKKKNARLFLLVLAVIVVILVSCKPMTSVGKKQILDFGSFTIECPANWKQIKKTGIDSYVGVIEIGSKETLDFDLGWYSNDLIHTNQSILWDTIDGRRAKIVMPIKHNVGYTGVYFDSLWTNGSERTKFNLYGENLTMKNRLILLDAVKTLKFISPK